MISRAVYFAFVLLALLAALSGRAGAQETISYGQTVAGVIDAQTPRTTYTFDGLAGDLVSAYVIGSSETLQPALALSGPPGPLVSSAADPYTPIQTDAGLSYRLPASGSYSLIVSGTPGTAGDFVLALDRVDLTDSIQMTLDAPVQAQVNGAGSPAIFSFEAGPDFPLDLTLRPDPAGFPFVAAIYGPDGRVMAIIGASTSAALTIPPGQGSYDVQLSAADPAAQGSLTILVSGGESAPTAQGADGSAPPANACTVTPTSAAINIRSGPGAGFTAIGTLELGSYLTVTGQSGGWYTGSFNGQSGWVVSGVVTLNGPCSSLPDVQGPASPPTQQYVYPTLTLSPSYGGQDSISGQMNASPQLPTPTYSMPTLAPPGGPTVTLAPPSPTPSPAGP